MFKRATKLHKVHSFCAVIVPKTSLPRIRRIKRQIAVVACNARVHVPRSSLSLRKDVNVQFHRLYVHITACGRHRETAQPFVKLANSFCMCPGARAYILPSFASPVIVQPVNDTKRAFESEASIIFNRRAKFEFPGSGPVRSKRNVPALYI